MTAHDRYHNTDVAVLGGAGFIGRELLSQLRSLGAAAYAVGGRQAFSTGGGDLAGRISTGLLQSLPNRPSVIFHLAGGASVARSVEAPALDFELTVGSVIETLEYLRLHNPISEMVYVSSAAVYGNSIPAQHLTTSPVSPYGLHKKLSEQLCSFYASRYGLRISIVRPFSVYGPGLRKQLLWDALNKIDRGDFKFFGTGNEVRDWVYVADLASLLLLVGCGEIEARHDQPLDAGTGTGTSVRDILSQLIDIYSPGNKPFFAGEEKIGDPHRLVAPTTVPRVRELLCRTSVGEGLARYVEWYAKEKLSC